MNYDIFLVNSHLMLDNKEILKGLNHGKGVIRFSNPIKLISNKLKRYLQTRLIQVKNLADNINTVTFNLR
jgi:hypothetical protein